MNRVALWFPRPGTATLEAAIVFPVLLVVLVGLVQLAVYLHARNVVTAAVQEGARVAAAENQSVPEGIAHAQALLDAGLGKGAQRVAVSGTESGEIVALEASGRWRTIIPWLQDSTLPLGARAQVSKETFRPGGGNP